MIWEQVEVFSMKRIFKLCVYKLQGFSIKIEFLNCVFILYANKVQIFL
jgi:hypothetical protein